MSILFKHLSLLLIYLTLSACQQQELPAMPVKAIKTVVVKSDFNESRRSFSGLVQTSTSTDLSFQVAGTVTEVKVRNGEQVKQGQLLASLDTKDLQLSVAKNQAELVAKQAELDNQQQELQRKKQLQRQQLLSKSEVDKATNAVERANSNFRIANIQLENSQRDLAHSQLFAPFNGVITNKDIQQYSEINTGKTVFSLANPSQREVWVLVPETLIRKIVLGQKVEVGFPTLTGATVNATVTEISAQVTTGNAFQVKAAMETTQWDIRTGMSASATFVSQAKKASILIPISALALQEMPLAQRNKNSWVFIYQTDSQRLAKRKVNIGLSIGDQIEIIDGLKDGDIVAVAGVAFLRNDMPVQLWQQGL